MRVKPGKRVLSVILTVLVILMLLPTIMASAVGDPAPVRLEKSVEGSVAVNQTFTVAVTVSGAPNVAGASLELQFDPNILAVVDAYTSKSGTNIADGNLFYTPEGDPLDYAVDVNSTNNIEGRIKYTVRENFDQEVNSEDWVGVDATQKKSIAIITFRAKAVGTSSIYFVPFSVSDSGVELGDPRGVKITSEPQNTSISVVVAAPTADLQSGTFNTVPQYVYLSTEEAGGSIYYTIDNTDPESSETRIQYDTVNNPSIEIAQSTTLKAVTEKLGQYSQVSEYNYTIEIPEATVSTVAAYKPGDTVTISGILLLNGNAAVDKTVSARILKGTQVIANIGNLNPTGNDGSYSTTYDLPADAASGTYTAEINYNDIIFTKDFEVAAVLAPMTNTSTGTFNALPKTVDLSTATVGATVYYTTDLTNPATSNTRIKYTGLIDLVAGANTIKAVAVKSVSGVELTSSTTTLIYTIEIPETTVSTVAAYKPGDTVTISGILLLNGNAAVDKTVSARILKGTQVIANIGNLNPTGNDGSYSTTYDLPADAASGTYTAEINYNDIIFTKDFEVAAVLAPTTNTSAGTYNVLPKTVDLSTATVGATVYYTTDLTNPTTSNTRIAYTAPINLVAGANTIKAVAVKTVSGIALTSSVTTLNYTIEIPTTTVYTDVSAYKPGDAVTISGILLLNGNAAADKTVSARILKGTQVIANIGNLNPTGNDGSYSATYNLPANATAGEYIVEVNYNNVTFTRTVEVFVMTVTASPQAGLHYSPQKVTLSSTVGATVYYTTDGSDPMNLDNNNRKTYTVAIDVPMGSTTIKAYAVKIINHMLTLTGPLATFNYTVENPPVETPPVTPPAKTDITVVDVTEVQKQIDSAAPEITVTVPTAAKEQKANISAEALTKVAETLKPLVVSTTVATIKVDSTALKAAATSVAANAAVNIGASEITSGAAIEASKQMGTLYKVAGKIIDITATAVVDGKESDLKVTGPIQITLPYDTSANADNLGVYWYNPAAGEWEFIGGVVDTVTKTITVSLDHLSIYAVMEYSKAFIDTQGHWAQAEIEYLAAKHIVGGTTSGLYLPASNITRQEFAAILVRALNLKYDASMKNNFQDVNSSMALYQEVITAASYGLVNGYPGNEFRPTEYITRQQMAALIARAMVKVNKVEALNSEQANSILAAFNDSGSISTQLRNDAALAIQQGIVKGMTASKFAPAENATRAQAAVMLKRMLDKIVKQ